MAIRDLREFLSRLDGANQLASIKHEVAPAYEIGAVLRRAADLEGPALLFERVSGHEMPVVGGLYGTRERIAIGLETTVDLLVAEWQKRTQRLLPSVTATEAPCQEKIWYGEEVNLWELPVPIFNDLDGGPFITAGCVISLDPETGNRNVGIYRHQVQGSRLLGILAAPYRHVAQHRASSRYQRLPVAVVIGVPPAVLLAAASDAPLGTDELERAGGLMGEAVEVVPCKTIPLEVPAASEIVLEAEFTNELLEEGPFGEFTGYYGSAKPRPTLEVKAITHRNDAIYNACLSGGPPSEDTVIEGIVKEAAIMSEIGLPGLRAIHFTTGGCGYFNAVAAVETRFEGYGKMMAMAILGTWAGRTIKNLIIVDSDVDPYNPFKVEWAIATRVQPARDVEILSGMVGSILDPSIDKADRHRGAALTSKMIIDATKYTASDYEAEVAPQSDVYDEVIREWNRYGVRI